MDGYDGSIKSNVAVLMARVIAGAILVIIPSAEYSIDRNNETQVYH